MMRSESKLIWGMAAMALAFGLFFIATNQAMAVSPHQQVQGTPFYLPLIVRAGSTLPTPLPTLLPTSLPTTRPTTPAPTLPPGVIVVDHNSIALFDRIPDQYLTAARNLRMVFQDRSVGQNISDGLDCLAGGSNRVTEWAQTSSACRRDYTSTTGSPPWPWKTFGLTDLNQGLVPANILFDPDPNKYSRANWKYVATTGTWEEVTAYFLTQVVSPAQMSSYDVASFQFSYLEVESSSDIASATTGYFADQPHNGYYPNRERWDVSDVEAFTASFKAQDPTNTYFYFTTSLALTIGTSVSTNFNNQVRQYAIANNVPLLDVAAILSHAPNGNPCYDIVNDGVNHPAICQHYTTETAGGHLGSVSGGKIRVAKAFWVLMAQIAGWRP